MGWFKRMTHKVAKHVARAKNFAKPIVAKAKAGWQRAGAIGSYVHNKVMPKAKQILTIASAIPYVQEFAVPALGAVTAGDAMLGKALETKAKIDAGAGRLQMYKGRVGQYHDKFKGQIARGDIGGLVKTGREAYKEGRAIHTVEKANYQQMRDSFH